MTINNVIMLVVTYRCFIKKFCGYYIFIMLVVIMRLAENTKKKKKNSEIGINDKLYSTVSIVIK